MKIKDIKDEKIKNLALEKAKDCYKEREVDNDYLLNLELHFAFVWGIEDYDFWAWVNHGLDMSNYKSGKIPFEEAETVGLDGDDKEYILEKIGEFGICVIVCGTIKKKIHWTALNKKI